MPRAIKLEDRKRAITEALEHLATVFIFADGESTNNIISEYVTRGTVKIGADAETSDGRMVHISITVGKPIRKASTEGK